MSGGGIFLLVIFAVVAVGAISRAVASKKNKKNNQA